MLLYKLISSERSFVVSRRAFVFPVIHQRFFQPVLFDVHRGHAVVVNRQFLVGAFRNLVIPNSPVVVGQGLRIQLFGFVDQAQILGQNRSFFPVLVGQHVGCRQLEVTNGFLVVALPLGRLCQRKMALTPVLFGRFPQGLLQGFSCQFFRFAVPTQHIQQVGDEPHAFEIPLRVAGFLRNRQGFPVVAQGLFGLLHFNGLGLVELRQNGRGVGQRLAENVCFR